MIRDFLMEYCDKPFVSGFEQMTPRLLPGYFAPYSDTYENDRRGSYMKSIVRASWKQRKKWLSNLVVVTTKNVFISILAVLPLI